MNTDNAARGEKIKPEKCSTLIPLLNTGTFFSQDEWLALHQKHLELSEQGSYDILLLGDSILFGWQWPGRPEIWEKYFEDVKTANLAASGDYIQHLLWRIENGRIGKISPRVTILLIGANNLDDYGEKEIGKGVMKILNRVKRECADSAIILTGLFPRGREPDTPMRRKIITVNSMIFQLADGKRVFFHDPGPALLEPDGTMDRKMFYDFCHPNVAGYAKWAKLLDDFVKEKSLL